MDPNEHQSNAGLICAYRYDTVEGYRDIEKDESGNAHGEHVPVETIARVLALKNVAVRRRAPHLHENSLHTFYKDQINRIRLTQLVSLAREDFIGEDLDRLSALNEIVVVRAIPKAQRSRRRKLVPERKKPLLVPHTARPDRFGPPERYTEDDDGWKGDRGDG